MKSFGITADVHEYVLSHSNPGRNPAAEHLAISSRERFGDAAGMNIGHDQGQFLESIVRITQAKYVVEVGTFTGMSALWLAKGLTSEGRLVCFELVDTYLATATEAWAEAGVADRIEVRLGPAAEGLAALPETQHVDVAFIDADKVGYRTYLDLLLPRMTDHGVVLVDNVLWSVAQRDDCSAVILTIGDGVTMIRPTR